MDDSSGVPYSKTEAEISKMMAEQDERREQEEERKRARGARRKAWDENENDREVFGETER